MKYSTVAEKYGLEPVEIFCPDGQDDFEVYIEGNFLKSNEDFSKGDIICCLETDGIFQKGVGIFIRTWRWCKRSVRKKREKR